MSKEPGFARSLREELENVLPEYKARVHRAGALPDNELVSLTTRLESDPATYLPDQPDFRDIRQWDEVTPADELNGERLIREGKVAFVILAGGAGTRMGGPKVFAQIPGVGTSLLAWKVMQGGGMPTWIMSSAGHLDVIANHMKHLALPPGSTYSIFEQFEGYRLTPDNRMSWVAPNVPDLYPLGHGDVGPALVESGVLDDNPDVEYTYICNVDNVMASPHPGLIGYHARAEKRNVTCEVTERFSSDKGGVLAVVDNRLQIAEDWRLPNGFSDQARWHNTNTMIIDTRVFKANMPWRWHRVRKQVGSRLVIQHERLLQQYTEEFTTQFVHVPRGARYMPVKTHDDLEAAGKLLSSYRYV